MTDSNKPVHRVRLGAIAASVFANHSGEATYYSVQFDRAYMDGENWKHTKSFGRDDLLVVAKVADLAHSWIHAQRAGDGGQEVASHPEGPSAE